MGSGETAPTMVKVHRTVVERLGEHFDASGEIASGKRSSVAGLLLDTPFGFQTNAAEIGARAVSYFRESVGATIEVAGLRSSADLSGETGDRILARVAEAPLVFAGPGSPSYALRQWEGTLVPSLLKEKMALGGAVTFASAAALTLGIATVPVYEIYKVGEDPHWLEGLDLLGALGLPVVFIPHYDNAEGQTHDTRYCYLGEERLSTMEQDLDADTFILGVDEHTALLVDFGASTASVLGRGGVTVRVRGRSQRIETGEVLTLERMSEMARSLEGASGHAGPGRVGEGHGRSISEGPQDSDTTSAAQGPETGAWFGETEGSPLLQSIRTREAEFRRARDASDAPGMLGAALGLEEDLWAWRADTLQSDEMDRGRASLRSMITELGRLSEVGTRDPAALIGPYVEVALALRESARKEKRFDEADEVRERLEILGVEVHDTSEGSTWELQRGDG
jgi:hypothetical protein